MYNYYRWFPDGKVVFMAPTKPLVNQQVEACHNIVGTTMMPSTFVCVIERMKIDNVIVAAFVAAFVAVVARYSGKRDCTSEWDREFKDENGTGKKRKCFTARPKRCEMTLKKDWWMYVPYLVWWWTKPIVPVANLLTWKVRKS